MEHDHRQGTLGERARDLYAWGVYLPAMAWSTAVCGVGAVLSTAVLGEQAAETVGWVWSRINASIAGMRVTCHGFEHITRGQSYVVVANHQSQFDIFVLYGWLPVPFRWVMKAELLRVPFLGAACKAAGHIFIDRSDPVAARAAIAAARPRLVGGTSVVFFPEGTRSADGTLGEIKKGAFRLAIDLGLAVLPVTLCGTREILRPHTLRVRPGRVHLVVGAPLVPQGFGGDAAALAQAARAAIAAGFDQAR